MTEAEEMRKLIDEFQKMTSIERKNNLLYRSKFISKNSYDEYNPIEVYFSQYPIEKHVINEGLIMTYPVDQTVKYLKNYFKLNDNNFIYGNNKSGSEKIIATFPYGKNSIEIMDSAMSSCGWYHDRIVDYPYDEETNTLNISVEYCRKYANNISDQLRNETKYLYHISPLYYKTKILSIGFCPYHRNTQYNYPERIHFIKGNTNENDIIELAKRLYKADNVKKYNNGIYCIYQIDLNKVNSNIIFVQDPDYEYGIYTTANIGKESIIKIGKIDLNDENAEIEWN